MHIICRIYDITTSLKLGLSGSLHEAIISYLIVILDWFQCSIYTCVIIVGDLKSTVSHAILWVWFMTDVH